jgi:Ca2+-transporting ATPase
MAAPISRASVLAEDPAWYRLDPTETARRLSVDIATGLTADDVAQRLANVGPNTLAEERRASVWRVALGQLRDPMTMMLVVVAIVSAVIGQASTAGVVVALILLNVVLGTNQELKARASVEALARLQVPEARVLRDGVLAVVPAADLVPGDVVAVEAGDLVPADGRIIAAATLETQESALTGESAPVAKSPTAVGGDDVALGDRSSMLFQNTSVTRGSARIIVTETGMRTEVGRIASMLDGVTRTTSPLQRQLNDLTRTIGFVAWGALAVILVVGIVRGLPFADLMLLGISMAISAIPTGMPTFVQTMLAVGARELAAAKAIVRNLADVETLGATSQINTDKTGTLTLNEMTARAVFSEGQWLSVSGEGYSTVGAVHSVAGAPAVDLTALGFVAALASDAVVSDGGDVVGDPTELAVVVLAEKIGIDVEQTRRTYPRLATVPFDSDYKFMATFHRLPYAGAEPVVGLVKGGPDVILARCGGVLLADGTRDPLDRHRDEITDANDQLAQRGLRVLAMAVRVLDSDGEATLDADPMAQVADLTFVGLVGIIDPLRPEAIEAVRMAHRAGIDVRMITGDHVITATAIGAQLGLGAGGITGAEFAKATDADIARQLPDLHVFGRVSPQDKLRLVQIMQAEGSVVAMTGDAVNDAAALKQADIGVAMGSGSEVSKQAAKMILTDDNFATLVTAVSLGRSIYGKISAYVGYQMSQLFALVSMFMLATAFNVNGGVAMLPMQVLSLNFAVAIIPIIIISLDPPDPRVMDEPPRDPAARIFDRTTGIRWIGFGLILGGAALLAVVVAPGEPLFDGPSTPITMGYVVMGLGTAFAGFTMHRTPGSSFERPVLRPAALTALGVAIIYVTTEVGFLQGFLDTVALSPGQWLACLGLALVFPVVVEIDKAWQRRRSAPGSTASPASAGMTRGGTP